MLVTDDAFRQLYAPRVRWLGFRLTADEVSERAAWAVVSQWLVAYGLRVVERTGTLAEAEEWFVPDDARLPRIADETTLEPIADLASPSEVIALLPYLLDQRAPGTRRSVLKDGQFRGDRRARKATGVYYTPADVARFMAAAIAAGDAASCLDPACGSGVFLGAVRSGSPSAPGPAVFGCDIAPLAAEQCAFVLTAGDLLRGAESPWSVWHSHRINLATVDSLLLDPGSDLNEDEHGERRMEVESVRAALRANIPVEPAADQRARTTLGTLFPELRSGAEAILCNPPYARLGLHERADELGQRYASFADQRATPASDVSGPFVEQTWRLINGEHGRAAIVVPLSVAFSSSTQFRGLREAMAGQPGRWRCAFFDRAPDALFGDDIKTRNAVLTYDTSGPRGIDTTSMMRWTSRNREQFLTSVRYTSLGDMEIARLIPRLGDRAEARLYRAVRDLPDHLGASVVSIDSVVPGDDSESSRGCAIYVAPTAYNWLNCARAPEIWKEATDLGTSRYTRVVFADSSTADAVYGLLSSTLVYWLWRIEGDAFHVPRRFLKELPFGIPSLDPDLRDELAEAGATLWRVLSGRPLISINKGRRSLAFPSQSRPDLVDELDKLLLRAYGLRMPARGFDLRAWYEGVVMVDPKESRRARRLAAAGVPVRA